LWAATFSNGKGASDHGAGEVIAADEVLK